VKFTVPPLVYEEFETGKIGPKSELTAFSPKVILEGETRFCAVAG